MLKTLRTWLRYQHARWIWLRLSPKERQAVGNASAQTIRRIDAALERCRELDSRSSR